ncbi:ABC transporter permease [Runella sp. MFBS21]|uniref:ABC transporter permease n=1 Tax=Runella sp. MFBS21 TaxID=3034018 RepID=UPI0023FA3F39|nr:ABC transporter permease [Runella sp. MFBS21]MDF7822354.1 ABC transporter permease [Runella sp. MFBS21]
MIGSYLKTSSRNLMRNKLFSFINIVGLAISMSVGLLLIAFIMDLYSYDRFHINGERIYRITHVATVNDELSGKFGSTSLKLGKLIREKVAGAQEVAIVHNDFSQDAKVGENILPIKGFWADPSLFKVFTFPMLEGNPEIALKEPYSIVVTETTAKKLFGSTNALGKVIQFDTLPYRVTGVIKDIPFFSHIHFEALVSLSTAEQLNKNNNYEQWANKWANYVYLLLPKNVDKMTIQAQLDAIAKEGNIAEKNTKIKLELLPLYDLVVGENLSRSEAGASTGPHLPPIILWIIGGLALIVIISACFNYTNLSIARAIRRLKEVGLRKAIGAGKNEILQQFLIEAIIISLSALVLSFFLFLTLRPILINLAPEMQRTIKLELTPAVMIAFIIFSIFVGAIAGFLPALFFSKVSAMNAFRNAAAPLYQSAKVFKHLNFRRSLVVIQYIFTLIFITTTAIGYVQYKNILAFDLGFKTENILNIDTQDNRPEVLLQELSTLPEVKALSRSLIVTSVGNAWGGFVKYQNTRDSALVMTNHVDENYLPLHEYKLIAGENFKTRSTSSQAASEMIVNQQFLKRFNIGYNDPKKAIGEVVTFSNFHGPRKATIVGVMKDFHYGKVDNLIGPVAFMHWTPGDRTIINVKIQSMDMTATLGKIESIWKKYDRVHPLKAQFYEEAIEEAYSEFSMLIKIIGFLAFLAVSIASMGLFGMVVFTTETHLKEIGIRKVMGATAVNLIYILSRGFILQLSLAAFIALPLTYLFFKNFVLTHFPYHVPVQVFELFIGLLIVLLIAFIMIASQTIKAAKSNPVEVLKNE